MRKGLKLIREIRERVDNLREDMDVAFDPAVAGANLKGMDEALVCIYENALMLQKHVKDLMDLLNQPEPEATE